MSKKYSISPLSALSCFFQLLSFSGKKEAAPLRGKDYVCAAKEYIKNNIHHSLSVGEVAQAFYINDRYLYNLFIKHEGISPKKYISKLRLDFACRMLESSSFTITEIAVSVGFSNVLEFSRFFSKNIDMSPSAYRSKYAHRLPKHQHS